MSYKTIKRKRRKMFFLEWCISHINEVKESGEFNDLETRLAWDFARATHYLDWVPRDEQGYPVNNDAQLSTLFKQALRNSVIDY